MVIIGQLDQIDNGSIATIGFIPSGLPPLSIAGLLSSEGPSLLALLNPAFVIGMVNLLESLSIAKSLARKIGITLETNQEIMALGLINLAGCCLSSPPTTGSFSRTAVGNNAGAKSPGAQMVVGLFVAIVLYLLTGFFSYVPFAAMAAIITVSVASLVDLELACYLWRVSRADFIYFLAACFGTLLLNVESGLLLAVALSITWTIYRSAFANKLLVQPLSTFDPSVHPDAHLVQLDLNSLTFLNAEDAESKIEEAIKQTVANGKSSLVIDLQLISFVDALGIECLEDTVIRSAENRLVVIFCGINSQVDEATERVRFRELVETAGGSVLDSHVCDLE